MSSSESLFCFVLLAVVLGAVDDDKMVRACSLGAVAILLWLMFHAP